MAGSTNSLTLTLLQQNSIGGTVVSPPAITSAFTATVGQYVLGSLTSSSVATAITLPTTTVMNCYIRNLAPSASSQANTITVNWTPGSSGISSTVFSLLPSAVIAFWAAASSSQTGFIALSLQPSNANTPYEIFLGG